MGFNINDLRFINYLYNLITIPIALSIISFSLVLFYIIVAKCEYKHPEMILVLVMSLIHIVCGISELVSAILKLVFGYKYLSAGSTQCIIFSFLIISTTRFELFTIGFLAYMRYAIICFNIKKSAKFWVISYIMVISPIVVLYIYPLIVLDANPSTSMQFCAPYLKPSPSLYVISLINSFIILIPCWITTYCYFVIGVKSYKRLNQIKRESSGASDESLLRIIRKQKYNLITQLLVVLIVFNIAYMPIYITMILRIVTGYRRPPIAETILMKLLEITRAIDPVITIIFQPELSHEFKAFLTKANAKVKAFIANLFQ